MLFLLLLLGFIVLLILTVIIGGRLEERRFRKQGFGDAMNSFRSLNAMFDEISDSFRKSVKQREQKEFEEFKNMSEEDKQLFIEFLEYKDQLQYIRTTNNSPAGKSLTFSSSSPSSKSGEQGSYGRIT